MTNKKSSFFKRLLSDIMEKFPLLTMLISGIIITSTIPTHVNAIINSLSLIVAFYMFCFILMSTINIFNGFSLNKKRTLQSLIISIICVTIEILFVYLYLTELIVEIKTVSNTKIIMNSFYQSFDLLIIASVLNVLGVIYPIVMHFVYAKKDDSFKLKIKTNKE